MTEAELQSAVIELARLLGWRVAHFRPAQTVKGWRTAVQGDGVGFPDLVLVRDGRLVFAELKGRRRLPSREQQAWLVELAKCVEGVVVWTPDDWSSGVVERALRRA